MKTSLRLLYGVYVVLGIGFASLLWFRVYFPIRVAMLCAVVQDESVDGGCGLAVAVRDALHDPQVGGPHGATSGRVWCAPTRQSPSTVSCC